MNVASRLSDIGLEQALFALGAVISGALTVLLIAVGGELVQGVLFGTFALYLLGAALPSIHDRVPEYNRMGLIALGGVGALAFLLGTRSVLPTLFVIGGVAAYFRLL